MERIGAQETVGTLVKRLVAALIDRGLSAEAFGWNMVWAANHAADPPGDDPRAAMSPGMRQTVLCRADEDGRLAWWWVWTMAGSDEPPDYEWLGPADATETAAEAIARVLAVAP